MEIHTLNKLAQKFWQGECTASEEKQLKSALAQGEFPQEHEALAQYLRFLEEEKNSKVLLDDFDEKMMAQISSSGKRSSKMYLMRVAAMILLMGGLSWFVFYQFGQKANNQTSEVSEFIDTYDNSEEAYREVKKALMMVSSEMSYGMEQTEKLSKFSEVKEELAITN